MSSSLFHLLLIAAVAIFACFADENAALSAKDDLLTLQTNLAALPQWLRYYMAWHAEQRQNHLHDNSTKFLTVACHKHGFCGGIADRMNSIPFFIEAANKLGRVFFIKWQKYNLEDFFHPLEGGLDWRLPDGIDIGEAVDVASLEIHDVLNNPDHPLNEKRNLVVRSNMDLFDPASYKTKQKPTGSGSYSNIMNILFVPNAPLLAEIRKTMDSLGLTEKKYVSAHYRVKADRHTEVNEETKAEALRAIDCAYEVGGHDKSLPIYFASSQSQFVKYVVNESPYAQPNSPVKVVGVPDAPRHHSDKIRHGYDDPRDLYPAFIDLWLIKESACVSFGHLSFGKLGSRLGGEECTIRHVSQNVQCLSPL